METKNRDDTDMGAFSTEAGNVDEAVGLMRETAQWLAATGRHLWFLEDLTKEKLTRGLQPGNFIVARVGQETAAAMILQWHDPLFWPDIGEGESGFIHKLCVSRKFAGRGISGKMIDFAVAECARKGVRWLRLDTDSTRPKLCSLYENYGFIEVGRKTVGRFHVVLYEFPVSL